MKFSISIGDLKYNISSLTDEFYNYHCKKYECEKTDDGFNIEVSNELLENFKLYDKNLSTYVNEVNYVLDTIVKHCLDYNHMIIHGSSIKYKDKGFLFIAPSQTGKTTHTNLWIKYLNDEVKVINGDKPMLKFDDVITIHGTPFNGKENMGLNISAPLKGIVVLKQAKENSIRKLNANESMKNLIINCFYAIDKDYGSKVINYISKIINNIPIYELECDVSKKAFDTCFNCLNKIN